MDRDAPMKAEEKARAALKEALKVCTVTDLQHLLATMQQEKIDEWRVEHREWQANQVAHVGCSHERKMKELSKGMTAFLAQFGWLMEGECIK